MQQENIAPESAHAHARVKDDDKIGEFEDVQPQPPWAQSNASAYCPEQIDQYMWLNRVKC